MLPSIALVHGVEMVRDGGSLAALFQGSNGSEYVLFFPLRRKRLATGVVERLGYEPARVIERRAGTEIQISWQHALTLIRQIRQMTHEPRRLEWLDRLEAVAQTEGALPGGVEKFLHPAKVSRAAESEP